MEGLAGRLPRRVAGHARVAGSVDSNTLDRVESLDALKHALPFACDWRVLTRSTGSLWRIAQAPTPLTRMASVATRLIPSSDSSLLVIFVRPFDISALFRL